MMRVNKIIDGAAVVTAAVLSSDIFFLIFKNLHLLTVSADRVYCWGFDNRGALDSTRAPLYAPLEHNETVF